MLSYGRTHKLTHTNLQKFGTEVKANYTSTEEDRIQKLKWTER